MKKWIFGICLILGLVACNDLVINSSSFDESRYNSEFVGGPSFQAIAPVIVEKCASCHQHADWATYTELQYEEFGLVVRSNVGFSSIYYRLSNSPIIGPGNAARNMPQGGTPAFTTEEVDLLEDWINNFEN